MVLVATPVPSAAFALSEEEEPQDDNGEGDEAGDQKRTGTAFGARGYWAGHRLDRRLLSRRDTMLLPSVLRARELDGHPCRGLRLRCLGIGLWWL